MNKDKRSFLLHIDSLDILNDLTDEQAGKLFKAIKSYQMNEEIELDSIVKIAFSPFKTQFVRDNKKYDETCKRRADAGRKGGLANASKDKQKVAIASNAKQEIANQADNKNKNKTNNKSKSDTDSNKEEIDNKPSAVDFSVFGMTDSEVATAKEIRKTNKGGKITQIVANTLGKQFELARLAGMDNQSILGEWATRGWKAFKFDWTDTAKQGKVQFNQHPNQPTQFSSRHTPQNLVNTEGWENQ